MQFEAQPDSGGEQSSLQRRVQILIRAATVTVVIPLLGWIVFALHSRRDAISGSSAESYVLVALAMLLLAGGICVIAAFDHVEFRPAAVPRYDPPPVEKQRRQSDSNSSANGKRLQWIDLLPAVLLCGAILFYEHGVSAREKWPDLSLPWLVGLSLVALISTISGMQVALRGATIGRTSAFALIPVLALWRPISKGLGWVSVQLAGDITTYPLAALALSLLFLLPVMSAILYMATRIAVRRLRLW